MALKVATEGSVIKLSGTIDDSDDLAKLIGTPTGKVTFHCGGITRINSIGIKNWIKHIGRLTQSGASVSFQDMAPVMVEQLNIVSNFSAGGTVESILAPYACGKCKESFTIHVQTAGLSKDGSNLPAGKCPKCGGTAQFDDLADDYLAFLP